ncbi:pseudouridine synthase [Endomicrobiia bacterium]|uniref:RluA family pseudouridine synthase n=1 Tax=Endomicrobium trichonymphae TaxID=1408204 RepID=UPI000865B5CA|nr:RluA family pseudouridine synthase [Candidatus Endomicrobium trichonymphae]GHT06203.1 pseudouridine synthase [Endomicrobiia bacterium]BAV59156.1 pseudouridylate synthase [Candidatus Endomicrobium trichonymphae]GHT09474.1 pseudouridine synthase [Endomicrobiia bacterium]GHT15212.1 pseudouridine synthase [Endomicrobiia bacterium]GHT18714.1 pseudouridine synthase [Endomicrobiia bacterium]
MQEKIIYEKFERERADSYLASIYKDYSRSYFQKLTDRQRVFVNDKIIPVSHKLKRGDIITIEFEKEEKLQIKPEKIKIDIIYEDDDIVVVNKRSGIVVHPSYGHLSGTLLNALMGYSAGKYNPYLVHRLDKDTSGVIVFAKTEKAKISISKQLQKRVVKKIYYAAVKGVIAENRGIIKAPLGRSPKNRKLVSVNPLAKKAAITEFKVIERKDDYTLLKVRIITGRTHQIRSHMKYINHPVIGDKQYGGPETIGLKRCERQMLHAHNITFTHPSTSKTVKFIAQLPNDMKEIFKLAN